MNSIQDKFEKQINELVASAVKAGRKGYVSSHGGNLSYRVDENSVLITPTKVPKEDLKFEDIVIIDMEGNIICAENGRKPTGESPMHLRMFKQRPDLNAIVHSHPPIMTGFAIAHSDLLAKPILPEVAIEVGPVLSVEYAQPLSEELAEAFDRVVDYSNAFLMKNHGVMICAREGITRAMEFTDMLESTASSLVTAVTLGKVEFLSENDINDLENVLRTRNMTLPGNPQKVKSLCELYA